MKSIPTPSTSLSFFSLISKILIEIILNDNSGYGSMQVPICMCYGQTHQFHSSAVVKTSLMAR